MLYMLKKIYLSLVFFTVTISAGDIMAGSLSSNSAHKFSFESIDGPLINLNDFKGHVILIINTASRCGFTRQYADMQNLWNTFKGKGFLLLGVPSNDFGGQEPGSEAQIKEFCQINFGVDFPLSKKEHVTGKNSHPFYKWAAEEVGIIGKPRWNFHKYLIGGDGKLIDWFSSPTSLLSNKVTNAIKSALLKSAD